MIDRATRHHCFTYGEKIVKRTKQATRDLTLRITVRLEMGEEMLICHRISHVDIVNKGRRLTTFMPVGHGSPYMINQVCKLHIGAKLLDQTQGRHALSNVAVVDKPAISDRGHI